MYCNNCGSKLEKEEVYCGNCGTKINQHIQVQENKIKLETNEEKKSANKLCIIAVILSVGSSVLLSIFNSNYKEIQKILSPILFLCKLTAIVIVIVTRVKYPNNVFAKVLMWILIIEIVSIILFSLFTMMVCNYFCS